MTAMSGHILFVPSWYPNRHDASHGLFNRTFAEAAARFHQVSVLHVCSDDTLQQPMEIVESRENSIYTCIVYYRKVRERGLLALLRRRRRYLQAFEAGYHRLANAAGRPDLIHLCVTLPAGLGAQRLARQHRLPLVVNEGWSGYYAADGNYTGWTMKHFTKNILKKAKAILPVSASLQQAMEKHGLTGNYTIVPNAIDETLFRPLTDIKAADASFVHISSLVDREKNVSGILRAFQIALRQQPELRLTIVGDGGDAPSLKAYAKELGIDGQVNFKGRLYGEALVREINAHAALLTFSHFETFGITLVEAMACGRPVIAARCGGVANLLDRDTGLVVDPRDEAGLSAALLQLTRHEVAFDPLRLREFVTRRFTVDTIAVQLRTIYATALC